jgi:hypothetical protein
MVDNVEAVKPRCLGWMYFREACCRFVRFTMGSFSRLPGCRLSVKGMAKPALLFWAVFFELIEKLVPKL